jgi:hypothetical protein
VGDDGELGIGVASCFQHRFCHFCAKSNAEVGPHTHGRREISFESWSGAWLGRQRAKQEEKREKNERKRGSHEDDGTETLQKELASQ